MAIQESKKKKKKIGWICFIEMTLLSNIQFLNQYMVR